MDLRFGFTGNLGRTFQSRHQCWHASILCDLGRLRREQPSRELRIAEVSTIAIIGPALPMLLKS